VTGPAELHPTRVGDGKTLAVCMHRLKRKCFINLRSREQGQRRIVLRIAVLIRAPDVFFLDVCGVAQDDREERRRR
jgi:hypothetical protein